jgi:glycosyltransferase involved in cell wall biosynthesis
MLTEFYPPIIGGIEQHVRNLSAALVARGHSVAVATVWQEGLPEEERDGDVRVYRLHGTLQRAAFLFSERNRRHVPPLPDPELVAGLRNVIARERPEIVHAHNWLIHSFLPLKAWSGARLVLTLHDYGFACAKQRLWHNDSVCDGPGVKCLACAVSHYGLPRGVPTVLANWTMSVAERKLVDMFVPVSQAVAQGTGLTTTNLPYQVIPNFIPDDLQVDGDARDARLPDEYLLFVGDISVDKGVHVLLQAYENLSDAPPLVLIGRQKIALRDELPKNVTLIPGLPHDAVMRAWQHSLLGLAPSIWSDPCPTVVMEAMAMGRPVIASRIGGLIDLVSDEETGLLVPAGDVRALREAIARLVADDDLRMRMGRAAQARVTQFQARAVVPRIEQVYRQVVGK